MDETLVTVIGGGLFTVIGGVIGAVVGGWVKSKQFKAERFREKEQGFEKAQVGYRICYRKFQVNLSAAHGVGAGFQGKDGNRKPVDFAVLQSNFLEAKGCNDPIVVEELNAFWPVEAREQGELPPQRVPESLDAAMRDHGSRTFAEHEALVAEYKQRPRRALAAAAG